MARKRSPLECTVLGVVWKSGPCSAYGVLSQFKGSASAAYRTGAGSIYPILKRLAQDGLVKSTPNERNQATYEISPQGLEALRSWMAPPFTEDDFSCTLDPIRSRVYFLSVLTPEEQLRFLKLSLTGLEGLQHGCQLFVSEQEVSGDALGTLAAKGALAETTSRIAWLKQAINELRHLSPQ